MIDIQLINKEVLSEQYIRNDFQDQWNIYKLIDFVKHLKYASLCIFDDLGIVEIHRSDNALVHVNLNDNEFIDDHDKVNPS